LQNSPERDWICIQIPSPVIRRKGPTPFATAFSLILLSFVELRHKEHSTIVLYEVSLSISLSLSLSLSHTHTHTHTLCYLSFSPHSSFISPLLIFSAPLSFSLSSFTISFSPSNYLSQSACLTSLHSPKKIFAFVQQC